MTPMEVQQAALRGGGQTHQAASCSSGLHARRHRFLRGGTASFSGIAVLSVSWFLGLTFSRGPSPDLARLVQRSVILRQLDTVFPRPPGSLSGVQQVLAGVPAP